MDEIEEYTPPKIGSLVRIKKSFQSDKRSGSNPYPKYLLHVADYKMFPNDEFVIYLGSKAKQMGFFRYHVYSFIHEGIVWESQPMRDPPMKFLKRHVVEI